MAWKQNNIASPASASNTNTTPMNVAYPTGIAPGDVLILPVFAYNTGATFTISDTGFAIPVGNSVSARSAAEFSCNLYVKSATGLESGNFTVSSSGSLQCIACCADFSGGTTKVDGAPALLHNTNSTPLPWPSMAVASNNDLVLVLTTGGATTVSANLDLPSPWTTSIVLGNGSSNGRVWGCEYVIQTTAMNISAGNWTVTHTGNYIYDSVVVALQAQAAGATTVWWT